MVAIFFWLQKYYYNRHDFGVRLQIWLTWSRDRSKVFPSSWSLTCVRATWHEHITEARTHTWQAIERIGQNFEATYMTYRRLLDAIVKYQTIDMLWVMPRVY